MYQPMIVETEQEAETVIDKLSDLIKKYNFATVADLYELVGFTSRYTDEKEGWKELQEAKVTKETDGYLVNLPKPIPLD